MHSGLLKQVNEARNKRRAIALLTNIETQEQVSVSPEAVVDHPLGEELAKRFRSGKSGMVMVDGVETFIAMYVPPPRLIVIGAVHISQALFPMAQTCGFDVTIVDPRSAFATAERFDGVTLLADWPEEAFKDIVFDRFTALAALTHDPKIDDFPLKTALQSDCFYVGALGSRKTHAKRVDRLMQAGVTSAQTDRIHAPIGMNIGAATPSEIAVSVMAQIIQALRQDAV